MPDAKIKHEPSLVEKRKSARKKSKAVKQTAKARKLTRAAKRPARPVPEKDWLRKPARIRKIEPSKPLGMKRVRITPVAEPAVSIAPLKGMRPIPVGGEWKGIPLIPVQSSNVGSIGYSEEEALLVCQFLDGAIYEYYNVPESIYQRWLTAPSKGKFHWRNIRDVFEYQRVAG